MSKVVKYQHTQNRFPESRPLASTADKPIRIKSFEYADSPRYGKMAIIYTDDGKSFYTFSEVIMNQLEKDIKSMLEAGNVVETTVRKRRNYLLLE
jgi:hypothetical protein